MRHKKSGRKLNMDSSKRKLMFRNLAVSLFENEMIKTTLARAKELRRFVEPLITLSKSDSVARRRQAFSTLRNKDSVKQLFDTIGPKYTDRPGGYTRILKCGPRPGDNAPMAYVELVGREPNIDVVSEDD